MGQQQLLLLVLGIVIVGFAVMAGFVMGENTLRQRAADNLVDRNLAIASDAVFWKQKRNPFYGGNASYAGLANDGMQKLFMGEETQTGVFKITYADDDELEITATSVKYPELVVRTYVKEYEIVKTEVSYSGVSEEDS